MNRIVGLFSALTLGTVIAAAPPLAAQTKSDAAKPAKPAQSNKPKKAAKPVAKAKKAAPAKMDSAKVEEAFTPFCELWMGKLAVRERDNIAAQKWTATGSGYNATYVGYSKEHTCTVSSDGKVPIGRVLYKEVTYRQEGSTLEEAKISPPQPIEIYEVTELFQFAKGKWSTD